MVGWIILGVLVALIVGLCLIPVGVDFGYEGGSLHLSAKVAGIALQLLPKPPGEEKPPKKQKEKKKKEEKPKEEKPAGEEKKGLPFGLELDDVFEIVKGVFRGIGRFGRKLRVDRFLLHFTASERDPYNTAVTFAHVNELLCLLAPLCRKAFTCRDCDVRTEIDFVNERMRLDFGLGLSIRIGQIFGVVNSIAFHAIKVLLASRKRQKREAKKLLKQTVELNQETKDTTQTAERTENNG